jgi:hypothetical protein
MLNNSDPRAHVVRLEAERDLELTKKRRMEDIRSRTYLIFCLSTLFLLDYKDAC